MCLMYVDTYDDRVEGVSPCKNTVTCHKGAVSRGQVVTWALCHVIEVTLKYTLLQGNVTGPCGGLVM